MGVSKNSSELKLKFASLECKEKLTASGTCSC